MQNRTLGTVLAAASALWSLIALVGPFILRLLGCYDQAQELSQGMRLLGSLDISWFGIYLWVFIASDLFLVALQWQLISETIYYWTIRNQRDWNMPGHQISEYIKNSSQFARSLPRDGSFETVAGAIQEAVREGRLKIAGRKINATKITPISRKDSKDIIVSIEGIRDAGKFVTMPTHFKVENRSDPKEPYAAIFADRQEVERVWPRA